MHLDHSPANPIPAPSRETPARIEQRLEPPPPAVREPEAPPADIGQPESPFTERAPDTRGARAVIGGSDDYYGAFSIETFCDQASLSDTHEDAQGWLDYVTQFKAANFWYRDGNVKPWAYYEQYDNWQDTYGLDAVNAVYHSGHGGMDGNGVFYVPMGGNWGNLGCTATSNNMRIGNEQANYVFWSTCLSCRVLDGHSPIRTWAPANLGFRMLFGFETVSVDDPNYGRFFWEEWNKGKSFSTAWLDASWRISHGQAPSVVAVGQNADEARNRVFNERLFSWSKPTVNYWWWRWYYAARAANSVRELNRTLPAQLGVARLRPVETGAGALRAQAERFGLPIRASAGVRAGSHGLQLSLREGDAAVTAGRDGSLDVRVRAPNLHNRSPLPVHGARERASEALHRFGLGGQADLVFDRVLLGMEAGGTHQGSGAVEGPFTSETVVQFRQSINGIPVITPHLGTVRVALDNDGTVTSVHSSTREIDRLTRSSLNGAAPPEPNGHRGEDAGVVTATARAEDAPEEGLQKAWTARLARWALSGRMPPRFAPVPGTTEIGYDIQGNHARLVAQQEVEVDFGQGYAKRYRVVAPLVE